MRMIDADELTETINKALETPCYNAYQDGYDAALNTLLDYIADMPTIPAPQWISVEDNLPPLDTNIIVCVSDLWDNRRYVTMTQRVIIEDEIAWLGYSDSMHVITHWMYCPETPEKEGI